MKEANCYDISIESQTPLKIRKVPDSFEVHIVTLHCSDVQLLDFPWVGGGGGGACMG